MLAFLRLFLCVAVCAIVAPVLAATTPVAGAPAAGATAATAPAATPFNSGLSAWERSLLTAPGAAAMQPRQGPYRNAQYGFSLGPLPGRAYGYVQRDKDYGVLAVLGERRYLTVHAGYDTQSLGSAKAQMDAWLNPSPHPQLKRQSLNIDDLPAEQASWQQSPLANKLVVLHRGPATANGVFYTLTLVTTPETFVADEALFDAVLATFKTLPLPNKLDARR